MTSLRKTKRRRGVKKYGARSTARSRRKRRTQRRKYRHQCAGMLLGKQPRDDSPGREGSKKTRSAAPAQPDRCGVCLEDLDAESSHKMENCTHRFCGSCIDRWLGQDETPTTCPTCRARVSNQELQRGRVARTSAYHQGLNQALAAHLADDGPGIRGAMEGLTRRQRLAIAKAIRLQTVREALVNGRLTDQPGTVRSYIWLRRFHLQALSSMLAEIPVTPQVQQRLEALATAVRRYAAAASAVGSNR